MDDVWGLLSFLVLVGIAYQLNQILEVLSK